MYIFAPPTPSPATPPKKTLHSFDPQPQIYNHIRLRQDYEYPDGTGQPNDDRGVREGNVAFGGDTLAEGVEEAEGGSEERRGREGWRGRGSGGDRVGHDVVRGGEDDEAARKES